MSLIYRGVKCVDQNLELRVCNVQAELCKTSKLSLSLLRGSKMCRSFIEQTGLQNSDLSVQQAEIACWFNTGLSFSLGI